MIAGGDPSSFVGRGPELAVLEAELTRARPGTPRVVLVRGPAGIGKSRLLRQFVVQTADVRVLAASGDEPEERLPYGLIAQLAGSGEVAVPTDPRDDPFVVGARLLELLSDTGGERPLVAVVDDAHWADSPSLHALTFALRRLQVEPVLAVVAARDGPLSLPDGLLRLARERGRTLALGGLDVEDLSALASSRGRPLPRRAVERLHAHTGGNPLWASALLTELEPQTLSRDAGPLPAPRDFAALVVARLRSCDAATRALVQVVAVMGRCRFGVAATVAGLSDPAAALDEAVTAGLVDFMESTTGHELTFPHPLVRAAVYHDMGPAHRAELHARAADHLDGRASLEHRIAAALVEDAGLASEITEQARTEAAEGATGAAASHLLAAARLSPDVETRARLVLDAVELLLSSGEVAEATSLAGELDGVPDSARRRYVLGYLALMSGRQAEAEQLLVGAWELSDASEEQLRALVAALLQRLCAIQVRAHEVVEWGRRSLALGDHPLGASGLHGLVVYLALLGRLDEALALVGSLPEGSAAGLGPRAIGGLLGRGQVRLWTGDLVRARSDLRAVVDAVRTRLASDIGLFALGYLAETEYRLGAWDDSVAHAALALSLAADAGQTWALGFVHPDVTWVLAARGDWDAAESHVEAALASAEAVGDAASLSYASTAAVHVAFCRSRWSDAVAAARRLLDLPRQAVFEPGVLPWREQYADALVSLGRLEDAEAVLAPFEEDATSRGRRIQMGSAARIRGRLEAARGNRGAARDAFEAGLDHLAGQPTPFDQALLDEAYGAFLRRKGERRAAAVRLEAAQRTHEDLGARPFVERVERELAACGLSPRSRAARFSIALTPQELAVGRSWRVGAATRKWPPNWS